MVQKVKLALTAALRVSLYTKGTTMNQSGTSQERCAETINYSATSGNRVPPLTVNEYLVTDRFYRTRHHGN